MNTTDTQFDEKLRQVFKKFNPFMIWMWRLGLRRWVNAWPAVGGRIMVILHTGRKSGLRRLTPVNYAIVDGEIYCTAGFGPATDWYQNILANPQVEIWLPDSRYTGIAEDISEADNRLPLLRQVIIASGIVAPAMGINPHKLSDEDFDQVTRSYRLVRIHPRGLLAGSGGPGDLAWIWLPILAVAVLLMRRRRKRA